MHLFVNVWRHMHAVYFIECMRDGVLVIQLENVVEIANIKRKQKTTTSRQKNKWTN